MRARLGGVPVAIGVAAGESKVAPILGALRAGVVGTLVTDVATAEAVVALDAETLADAGPGARRAATDDDRARSWGSTSATSEVKAGLVTPTAGCSRSRGPATR